MAKAPSSSTMAMTIPRPRTATLCRLHHPHTNECLESQALSLYFPGPRSFTGEDCVELHVHGSPVLVHDVIDALQTLPAFRLANAGEFTRRAFLNGKMDLTQVEGLSDLLECETQQQRRQAQRQMDGELGRLYESWRVDLTKLLAHVEAVIDFSESEDDVGEREIMSTVLPTVDGFLRHLRAYLRDGRRGELMRRGLAVAIVGAPNAGKSSLLNRLARRNVAIVAPTPGTTRDVLEISLNVSGYPFIIADTAGLRESDDVVEQEGVRRAHERLGSADLKIAVFDASGFPSKPLEPATLALIDADTIVVFNKADLLLSDPSSSSASLASSKPTKTRAKSANSKTKSTAAQSSASAMVQSSSFLQHSSNAQLLQQLMEMLPVRPASAVLLSCQENTGFETFLESMSTFAKHKLERSSGSEDPLITRARHRSHLQACAQHLEAFQEHARQYHTQHGLVLGAEELRHAIRALGKITGKVDVEDLLDVIFRDFCIGK